jgi:thiamine-phosphate pyrophosphorylase
MTDERIGDGLGPAIARAAAANAGVIVRHHQSSLEVRRGIAAEVLAAGALLAVSRDTDLARSLGAALVHNPAEANGDLPFSLSVHDEEQALAAARQQPVLVFVSPLFATASHPGTVALGQEAAKRLADMTGHPAVALGGISRKVGEALVSRGWAGWAGIDAWL